MSSLLAVLLIVGAPARGTSVTDDPTDQTLVYYNARMALREGRPTEVLKLWLLRNAIESKTRRVSAHDDDFRSVAWAALGRLGLCPDGFQKDQPGVGLWPLALHNWVIRNMRSRPRSGGASPFRAFYLGRQQRFVSMYDVLDATELKSVSFRRAGCLADVALFLQTGESWNARITDRRLAARLLRHLLRTAGETLAKDRVVGRAVLESRIFDLNLQMTALAARERRREARLTRRLGPRSGLSRVELTDQRQTEPVAVIPPESEAGRILTASLSWPAEEWMTLSGDRRRFLFGHALRVAPDKASIQALNLAIIDRLIDARRGAELRTFIAHLAPKGGGEEAQLIWGGERGRRLLSLDPETRFRERSVIALHRGVDYLSKGELPAALRSMAHAVRWAEKSRSADDVRKLGRRWLSFIASQFRVTDDLFAMLRSVVPRGDYASVLEDQLWHAALSADEESFERCVRNRSGRGALSRRAEALRPLARGDAGAFEGLISDSLEESPYFATRFVRRYLERLQAQTAEVRGKHVPTLMRLKERLSEELELSGATRSQKGIEMLITQMRVIIDGTSGIAEATARDKASPRDKAHALSPEREVFGGSLRVAPSDPLPWPFTVGAVKAPSVFTRVKLRPEEWRSETGELVFGWRVGD